VAVDAVAAARQQPGRRATIGGQGATAARRSIGGADARSTVFSLQRGAPIAADFSISWPPPPRFVSTTEYCAFPRALRQENYLWEGQASSHHRMFRRTCQPVAKNR